MQCPKCKYEPTMSEMQRSPDDCVACGVNYKWFESSLANQANEERARAAQLAGMAAEVREVADAYRGAQPVVVIDVRMSFWSMVRFMIKWAIATIPAVIILFMLFVGLTSFFGGLLQGIARYF
jgi:hypothetical protein